MSLNTERDKFIKLKPMAGVQGGNGATWKAGSGQYEPLESDGWHRMGAYYCHIML